MSPHARRRWRQGELARNILVGALVCLTLTLAPSAGAQGSREKEYPINVNKQPLTRALEQLNEQTGVFYGYIPDTTEEEQKLVGPVQGKYTIDRALTELLRSTDLTFEWTTAKTVTIIRRPPAPKPPPQRQVKRPRNVPHSTVAASSETLKADGVLYEVVTERSKLRSLRETVATVVVLDRQAIERSGAVTISDLLKYVPQQPYLRADGFRSDGAQYAELRGLGADTTMVLINGRRAFASAASFTVNAFDLSNIPLSAVERVEVLLDSTSVAHGTDAIGGIVNIVLRDAIPHPRVEAHYGSAQGGGSRADSSASFGYQRDGTRAAVILDYSQTQTLLGVERDLWANQDYRRFGSVDQRSINSGPGNVTWLLPGNLPGLNSSLAAIPEHIAGPTIELGEFLVGQRNYASLLQYVPIVPDMSRASIVASAQTELTPGGTVVAAELMYVDRSVRFPTLPPLIPGLPVPMTNPFNPFVNPFDLPVVVNTLLDGMQRQEQNVDSTLVRGGASLHGHLRTWDWEVGLVRSEEDAELRIENSLDFVRVLAVLANPDPTQTLDLFRPGPAADRALLDSLVLPTQVSTYATDGSQISGLTSGPVFELPGGPATATLGGEWRKESVQFDAALDSFNREVGAGFAELKIPLVGADMHLPALRELTVTAAGRLDNYSDFGSIFNPQFGLQWQPHEDLYMHASYGRSFRPPSMYELYFPRQAVPFALPIADPRRDRQPTSVALITGGNTELDPTRGESLAAGLVFAPQALAPLELSASYWRVAMDKRVTLLLPQTVLANEGLFPERVIRDAPTAADLAAGRPGQIRQIDISRMNFGRLTTSGVDLGVRYELESRFGVLTANAVATWIGDFETVDVPATPPASRINLANETVGTITKWRAVAGLDWDRGALSATTHLRYIPEYDDTRGGARNGRRLPAQAFVDMQVSIDLGKLARGRALLAGVALTGGASNLFDQQPHFAEVNGIAGYDTSQGDLKGRFWYLRLGKTF